MGGFVENHGAGLFSQVVQPRLTALFMRKKALKYIYENRRPILKTTLIGLKVAMLILSVLALPSTFQAAGATLERLGKIGRA